MTGIILAGGKNSRMGVKKAFLNIGGTKIIDNIIYIFKKIFDEIIIVTNTPEDYEYCKVKLVSDIIPGKGPLGGIYTGLNASKNQYCFVTACDMPFIDEILIQYIVGISGYDIVVPLVHGKYEPLFALYSKKCISVLRQQLKEEKLSLKEVFKRCSVKEIKEEELCKTKSELISFTNVNTPEEFENALRISKNMSRCENV